MHRYLNFALLVLSLVILGSIFVGCGTKQIELAKSNPDYAGAVIFSQRCAGCHTLSAAGTQGSGVNVRYKNRILGPSLDARRETPDSVLYAIRNGGFSRAIMPQNIVTGPQAELVAQFVAKYSGRKAKSPPSPEPILPGGG